MLYYTFSTLHNMYIGIKKFQNLWIYYHFQTVVKKMKNNQQYALDTVSALDSPHGGDGRGSERGGVLGHDGDHNFDYAAEIFDVNDEESMACTAETRDLRHSRREPVNDSTRQHRMLLATKLLTLLDTPWQPPNWEVAARSIDFTHPRRGGKGGTKFDFMTTTTGVL